ncbi:MAG: helix-turn-helix domain-containing protein [Clostridia bacterium]|nr:helix-turn-helix domain-containing protein [Clostridia bacterium]
MVEVQKAGIESPVLRLRKQAGITQRELAAAADVHPSIVAGLEAGVVAIEEDAEIRGKVDELFTKLSEWSDLDKNELLRQQIEFNRAVARELAERFAEKMKEFVAEALRRGAYEDYFGPQPLTDEIVEVLRDCLDDPAESPVRILREYAQISQRQLAIAAGVSQTAVARIEAGELGLGDPDSDFDGWYDFLGNSVMVGEKLLRFLVDALASECNDKKVKEKLALYIHSAQEVFREGFSERAKAKVIEAMSKLKTLGKDGKKIGAGKPE